MSNIIPLAPRRIERLTADLMWLAQAGDYVGALRITAELIPLLKAAGRDSDARSLLFVATPALIQRINGQ